MFFPGPFSHPVHIQCVNYQDNEKEKSGEPRVLLYKYFCCVNQCGRFWKRGGCENIVREGVPAAMASAGMLSRVTACLTASPRG